jgi:hypothetical protein
MVHVPKLCYHGRSGHHVSDKLYRWKDIFQVFQMRLTFCFADTEFPVEEIGQKVGRFWLNPVFAIKDFSRYFIYESDQLDWLLRLGKVVERWGVEERLLVDDKKS